MLSNRLTLDENRWFSFVGRYIVCKIETIVNLCKNQSIAREHEVAIFAQRGAILRLLTRLFDKAPVSRYALTGVCHCPQHMPPGLRQQ